MLNSTSSRPLLPYLVWSLGALFFLMEYFIRVSPSVITQDLMATFKVQAFALGGLSGFFYYAYISMQVPVGILVDRFGPRKLLFASTLLCSFSLGIFAGVHTLGMADLSRFLMGLGASFAFVGTLKLISTWFPAKRFALLAGVTQALGMIGAVIGDAPMSYIFHTYGWREAMWVIAILFFVLALLILLVVRDRNHELAPEHAVSDETIKIWPSLKAVLSNSQTWLNCVFIGLIYAPSASFGEQWGVSFVSTAHQINVTQAAGEIGTIFIGLAIGCPVLGWLSDRLGRRLIVMRSSALICMVLISLILYSAHILHSQLTGLAYIIVLFLYGFFNGGALVPSYALASEVNPRKLTGIALGVTNMASVIIGAIFIPLIGYIMDEVWDGKMLNGAPVFSISNYETAFILLPICFVIALLISFTIRETHCHHQKG